MDRLIINDLDAVKDKIVNEITGLKSLLTQTRNQLAELLQRESKIVAELDFWSSVTSFENKNKH